MKAKSPSTNFKNAQRESRKCSFILLGQRSFRLQMQSFQFAMNSFIPKRRDSHGKEEANDAVAMKEGTKVSGFPDFKSSTNEGKDAIRIKIQENKFLPWMEARRLRGVAVNLEAIKIHGRCACGKYGKQTRTANCSGARTFGRYVRGNMKRKLIRWSSIARLHTDVHV